MIHSEVSTRTSLIVMLALLVGIPAAKGQSTARQRHHTAVDSVPSVRLIDRRTGHLYLSQSSSVSEPTRAVIRDSAQAFDFLATKASDYYTIPRFLKRAKAGPTMLVIAALGSRPHVGDRIFIDAIRESMDTLTVVVTSSIADDACLVGASFSSPLDVVQLPRSRKTVVFEERKEIDMSCGIHPPWYNKAAPIKRP